jgi:protein-L-isoaspartate(D-aspartate) O-methyltransferase
MVIPIGPGDSEQELTVIEKTEDGKIRRKRVLPVRFAPLPGGDRI